MKPFFAPDEEIAALSDNEGTCVLAANWAKVNFTNLLFCIFSKCIETSSKQGFFVLNSKCCERFPKKGKRLELLINAVRLRTLVQIGAKRSMGASTRTVQSTAGAGRLELSHLP